MLSIPGRAARGAAIVALALAPALPVVTFAAGLPARADEIRDRQGAVLDTLGAEAAWRITRGKGVTVGLVDSGVDARQPDLKGSVTTGPDFLSEVDHGTAPRRVHGTAMASLIAGHGHGPGAADGIIGIAPKARILAVRSIPDREDSNYKAATDGDIKAVARAIRYVTDHGVSVINLSLGGPDDVAEQRAAIAYAIQHNVVVVASAGNDGDKKRVLDKDGFAPYSYPASYPGVIGVAATTPGHARAPFSNRNYGVLVGAPGDEIVSAGTGGDYLIGGGTSQAGALVSGVAALIRSRHPKLAPALVAQALVASTRHRPAGGYNADVGFGEVNAERALHEADRLAGYTATGGRVKDTDRFVGATPQAVKVVDRPGWLTVVSAGVIAIAVGCVIASFVVTGLLARRRSADHG